MIKVKHKKTYNAKKGEVDKKWYLIDAEDQVLGRLASKIAKIIRGKNKIAYTQNTDTGDFVVVINADKVRVTGKKNTDKIYYSYSGYVGGMKKVPFNKKMDKDARKVVISAVKGMLPKNRLSNRQITKCKVFVGPDHSHQAQKPEKIEV